jgi:hypothetical protein
MHLEKHRYREETSMKCNVGTADRIVRIIAGLVIIGLGVVYGSWLGVIGLVPLLTAALRWCPLYMPLGLSTIGKKE